MLGGQTVTEYSRKTKNTTTTIRYKSYVRAAGTVLAWQIHSFTPTSSDNLRFEHTDASGMSYRTTTTNGNMVSGFRQVEGSGAEMDALGGNVGLTNPYPDSPPEIPEPIFHSNFSNQPMFINGQKVQCNIDGIEASCHEALHMLENGSGNIDPRGTTADLPGIGIFYLPALYRNVHTGSLNTYGEGEEIFSGGYIVSWNPQQQTNKGPKIDPKLPSDLRDRIVDISKRADCKAVLQKMFSALNDISEIASNDIGAIFDRIHEIKVNPKLNTNGRAYGDGNKRMIEVTPAGSSASPIQSLNYSYKITLAELLHHSRKKGGTYSDKELDKAASTFLDPKELERLKSLKREQGFIGHTAVNTYCQLSQAEIDKGAMLPIGQTP